MNGTAMQLVGGAQMQPRSFAFSEEQRRLILDTCCGGASETEARVLLAIAEARGLNPLTGECYFVKRWDSAKGTMVWAVQASIDSFRIKAEETGDYGGQDEPEYEYDDAGRLVSAKVRVYRRSVPGRAFAVGVARWDEYVQKTKEGKPTRFWATMGHNQLAKCAEALALRKAFPKVLARIYTPDEMAQASNGNGAEEHDPETGEVKERPKTLTEAGDDKLKKRLIAEMRKCTTPAEVAAVAAKVVQAKTAGQITQKQRDGIAHVYEEVVSKIKAAAAPPDVQDADLDDPRNAEYDAETGHE